MRSIDVLGVSVQIGCTLVVQEANATLELRPRYEAIDLRTAETDETMLCRLRQRRTKGTRSVAMLTSVSDYAYLWKYWRWMLNKLCFASMVQIPYYLWIGSPLNGLRRSSKRCPASVEERLGHTTKALSLYALLRLKVEAVLFADADAWFRPGAFQQPGVLWRWVEATQGKQIALAAPCYKQFFGASVVLVRDLAWPRRWFDLRCGPKDQPSLWYLVLEDAGYPEEAEAVLHEYHDVRCVRNGELTKNDCDCASCGYYEAWRQSNLHFHTRVWPNATVEKTDIYEVAYPLFTPNVAYLPNVGPLSLLCGPDAPLAHVKFLNKRDRVLPDSCGALPSDLPFKGPRDNIF